MGDFNRKRSRNTSRRTAVRYCRKGTWKRTNHGRITGGKPTGNPPEEGTKA